VRGSLWCIAGDGDVRPVCRKEVERGQEPRKDKQVHKMVAMMGRSEETDRLAHRGLDVQALHVLPVLLEERDKEVDACRSANDQMLVVMEGEKHKHTQHDVTEDLIVSHLDVTNSNTEAEDLLELELDGRADLVELLLEVLGVRDGCGELAGCERIYDVRRRHREMRVMEEAAYPWKDPDRADGGSA
jgi:hypothetical protein